MAQLGESAINRERAPTTAAGASGGEASAVPQRARRVALVSGASSGIGRAIAERLAQDGLEVYGTSRKSSDAVGPVGVSMLELDVTSSASVRACVAAILAQTGRIDVLVNNAGYLASGAVEEVSLEEVKAEFETNFFGAVRMIQAVLPVMRARTSGTIVNITSLAGLVPLPFWGYYSASKAALESLTETLREELRPFGVQVSAVEPGSIKTPFYAVDRRAASMPEYAARRSRFEKAMKQFEGKAPGPEVVAQCVSRVVNARAPAFQNPVTLEAYLFPWLRRWFPRSWFERGRRSNFHLDDTRF